MRVALSHAYVMYVPILRCVCTHVVNGVYTVNCETRSRAPVVIKTNQRSMVTVCDHCAACGTVVLQACSKYQTEKGSHGRRVCIAVPLFAPLSQTDSSVRKASSTARSMSPRLLCSPAKIKRGHCLRSSHSCNCCNAR